jgi:SynChlorMet cassette radical SAM/SPASM protein ScmF
MGCEPELLKKETASSATRKLGLPEGVPPLTSLYLYIAGSCNLACRHCWISPTFEPDNSKGQFLKVEYIDKAVKEAKPLGLQSVKLTGGEPMLHPQFREIVEFLDDEGIGIIIETNGTLIDADLAGFLKSKKRAHFISVSLDGAAAASHEALRGVPGSFDQAVQGIKKLAGAGFHPQLICTLHKDNEHEIDRIIALAKDLGCGSVKFNILQQIGRGDGFYAKNGLNIKEILTVYNDFSEKSIDISDLSIHFDIPIAFKPIREILHGPNARCAIHNVLGILANGDLALCGIGTTEKKYVFGNIASDRIQTIWKNNQILNEIRINIPFKFEGICGECIFLENCLGHCIISNRERNMRLTNSFPFCIEADRLGLFPTSRKKNLGGLR